MTTGTGAETRRVELQKALEDVGFSAQEAVVYLSLLERVKTAQEIGREVKASKATVLEVLAELGRKGVVTKLPGTIDRFALAPPEWVLPSLLEEHQQALRRSTDEIAHLFQRNSEAALHQNYIEVVAGPQAVLAQINQILEQTRTESVSFVKAPIIADEAPGVTNSLQRGTRTRSVWERELLEVPRMLDAARRWSAAGEEIRVVPSLPSKLLIFDRKIALINVTEVTDGHPVVAGLLTRHPEVVASLYRLFELMWSRGLPLEAKRQQLDGEAVSRERLVSCLTTGMTDAAIQRVLGISRRTFSRRMRELHEDLGVSTRFQAGWKLAEERLLQEEVE